MFDYHLIFWRNIQCFNHIFSGVVAEQKLVWWSNLASASISYSADDGGGDGGGGGNGADGGDNGDDGDSSDMTIIATTSDSNEDNTTISSGAAANYAFLFSSFGAFFLTFFLHI